MAITIQVVNFRRQNAMLPKLLLRRDINLDIAMYVWPLPFWRSVAAMTEIRAYRSKLWQNYNTPRTIELSASHSATTVGQRAAAEAAAAAAGISATHRARRHLLPAARLSSATDLADGHGDRSSIERDYYYLFIWLSRLATLKPTCTARPPRRKWRGAPALTTSPKAVRDCTARWGLRTSGRLPSAGHVSRLRQLETHLSVTLVPFQRCYTRHFRLHSAQ